MVEGQLKLEWRVSPPALIEALLGGCQFCCYVAVRTLTRKNFRTFNLSIRDGGVRCCAQGSVTRDSEAIQSVIDALCEADWSVCSNTHRGHLVRSMKNACSSCTRFPVSRFLKLELSLRFQLHTNGNLDDGSDNLITTRPLTTSRGEGENIEVIQRWLKDCQG